ncbi:MAG: ribosome biogenesis GTPase Der [Candidatus Aminicenantes bacterium]|nr:ribosome biogenesis GTPase Der [Candidatus Aminicenantes bacterium]
MRKIPLITIVGVPNTGKSTFFNRIIGKRKALIHSAPGMTRDIYKVAFSLNGRQYYIQDTGGFFIDDNIITYEINKRIFKEAQNSDLVIFLFDGKRELLGYEKDLYLDIKKINNNIIPVVNKVDNPDKFILPPSYYSLKVDFFYTSAEHGTGFYDVIAEIDKTVSPVVEKSLSLPEATTGPRISITGKPNVGKSSLINKILNDDFVIVSPLPGTTRDSIDLEIKRNKKTFTLVDNAGIRKLQKVKEGTESAAVIRAGKDVKNADIIIFVVDVSRKIDQNDLFIARKILQSAKPVIIACNKWDLVKDRSDANSLIDKIKGKFNFFYFAPVFLVSALSGKNVFSLIDQVDSIHEKLSEKIKTPYLNKITRDILNEKKLSTETNRVFNPKYVSIESYRPFFITFHTSSRHKLKTFHEQYLKKRITEKLELKGIPIFFKIISKSKHSSAPGKR